jgi:hypothetical protein
MITIFNRKELISTYDMKKQVEVHDLLNQFKIPYSINVINRKSPSIFGAGSRARCRNLLRGTSVHCSRQPITLMHNLL